MAETRTVSEPLYEGIYPDDKGGYTTGTVTRMPDNGNYPRFTFRVTIGHITFIGENFISSTAAKWAMDDTVKYLRQGEYNIRKGTNG